MKFAAIDFETASFRSDSPCQVAVVVVENGKFVEERSWLIRPKSLFFSDRCIAVHGILPRDVMNEPEWDRVWTELAPLIHGHILLAHNAMFDMNVLASTLIAYDLVCPRIEFQCTRLIARRCWPGRTGYGLKPTAESLGIFFQHHVALEDARTCAEIALAAARVFDAKDITELEQHMSIRRGSIEYGKRTGPRCISRSKSHRIEGDGASANDGRRKTTRGSPKLRLKTLLDACSGARPFENKRIFLSGSLLGLDRLDSIRFLQELGGIVEESVTEETHFWIEVSSDVECSTITSLSSKTSIESSATSSATELSRPYRINQRQLLAMIPGGLRAARTFMGSE